jgi:hypothetical protein
MLPLSLSGLFGSALSNEFLIERVHIEELRQRIRTIAG